MTKPGILYGIGVGPGDPELLTLRARQLLKTLDVIAYMRTASGQMLAREICAPFLEGNRPELCLDLPVNAGPAAARAIYERNAQAVARVLDQGQDVGLLCLGDPLFYGSFIKILDFIHSDYEKRVVPGIPAMTACAAVAGQVLAVNDDSFVVLPALLPNTALKKAIAAANSAAIVKVGQHFPRIRTLLKELELIDRAWLVEKAGMAGQRVMPMTRADMASVSYFTTILIPSLSAATASS